MKTFDFEGRYVSHMDRPAEHRFVSETNDPDALIEHVIIPKLQVLQDSEERRAAASTIRSAHQHIQPHFPLYGVNPHDHYACCWQKQYDNGLIARLILQHNPLNQSFGYRIVAGIGNSATFEWLWDQSLAWPAEQDALSVLLTVLDLHAPTDALEQAISCWQAGKAIVHHPNTNADLIHQVAVFGYDAGYLVLRSVAAEAPNAHSDTLDMLANDSNHLVRTKVALHPACGNHTLVRLAADSDRIVRAAVAQNQNAPSHARVLASLNLTT